MKYNDILLSLFQEERDIYQEAKLFHQNRHNLNDKIIYLKCVKCDSKIEKKVDAFICKKCNTLYPSKNNILNFIHSEDNDDKAWGELNKQFLNYHKSLTVYTLLNSAPIVHYIFNSTRLSELKNQFIIDVGAGTGNTYFSALSFPETNDYYLTDPNIRLVHDQFIRIYPNCLRNKLTHLLCFAENLPFQSEIADYVFSISSIDHMKSYKQFIQESHRVLKQDGKLFIMSHLDVEPMNRTQHKSFIRKIFSKNIFEKISRYLYYKRNRVKSDDHTFHFYNTDEIIEALTENKFKIEINENEQGIFWILASKQ